MATQAELDAFSQKWGAIQSTNTAPPSDVDSFAAKWFSGAKQANIPQPTGAAPGVGLQSNYAPNPEWEQMGIPDGLNPDPVSAEQSANREILYQQENYQGVPLDTQSGADALTRLKLGMTRNKEDQLDVLRRLYGQDKVRMDKKGNFIVRTQGEDGKPKDLVVDENEMSAKDLLDLASEVPALVLSMAGTKGVPVGKVFQMAARGAGGYAIGGGLTDAIARIWNKQPVRPEEIVTERGAEAIPNAALGYGFGKVGQAGVGLLKMTRGAASKVADSTVEGAMGEINAARERVGEKFKVEFEPTIGELTANPMVTRLEAFLANIPGARNMIIRNWRRAIQNEKAVMESMGAKEIPDLGERVIDQLQGQVQRTEGIRNKAASIVEKQAQTDLTDPLNDIAGKALSPFQFGQRMIRRGEAQLQSFKNRAEELFAPLRNAPEANQPLFDAAPIQSKAQALKDQLLKDQSGNVARGLAPSGLLPILDEVERLSPTQSWFELKDLRSSIYDRMGASSEPISDKATKLLKELGASITSELESQAPQVFTPELLAQSKAANKFYRDNVESFYQKGILGMLKPRTEAGAIDPERIAANLLAGGKGGVTQYNTLKEFFEKPQAVADMNRLLRDKILDAGTDTNTGLVSLSSLQIAVSKLEPEIVQNIFGIAKDKLLGSVKAGQLALKTFGKAGSVPVSGRESGVEYDALVDLFQSGKADSYAIRKLAEKTIESRKQYGNSILSSVRANDFGAIEADPKTFVQQYIFNPSTKSQDVKEVMQSIASSGDVELIGDIRRQYLADVFRSASKTSKGDPLQLATRVKGSPLMEVDPQTLSLRLQSGPERQRAEMILGKEGFDDLQSFALAIGGRSGRDLAGATTGAFTGGKLFHELLSGLQGLPEIAQYSAMSYAVTSPNVLKTLKTVSKFAPENLNTMVKSMVLTPEFIRAVISDADNPEEARQIVQSTQRWANTPAQ